MSKIAIDFGTTRTKVAYLDSKSGKPQIIELGREIRAIIPSLFHIPKEGDFLVGDNAVEEAKLDRRGVVRGLKMQIDKRPPLRRNKRKVNRIELASIMFSFIKQQCEELHFHDEEITECVITIPPTFATSPNKLESIKKAAELGGFQKIETVEEPVAAAKHWLTHGHCSSDFIFVCDIGGGTSDFALLKKIPGSNDFQLYTELLPIGIDIGGNSIDDSIFDQLDFKGVDAQDRDAFLLQIRQYKEYCSRSPKKNPKIVYKKQRITNLNKIILNECVEFTDYLIVEIEKFIKKAREVNSINLDETPLLLVGGGMHIYGLKDAFGKIWPGEVISWTESEHSTVLGAIVDGKVDLEYEDAEKHYKEASSCWYEKLYNTNKLYDIDHTTQRITKVISLCNDSLKIVDRYPAAFNLKNVLTREKNLLEEIEKVKNEWVKNEFENVVQLCLTAIKLYQKDDLPLPVIDYYDDDLITQVKLIQAEAWDALGKHKDVKSLTEECLDRKPDSKSSYTLRVLTILKGITKKQFESNIENWSLILETIEIILSLPDDEWGLGGSYLPVGNLLIYKAYAEYNQNNYKACQVTLKRVLNDSGKTVYNLHCLSKVILAYVYIKNNELAIASSLIDTKILIDDKLKQFISNKKHLESWIKNDLVLAPEWSKIFSFTNSNDLLDTLLRWWVNCNDINSQYTVSRLYMLNSFNTFQPWKFSDGSFIQNESGFLLKMASVMAKKGKKKQASECLMDLWEKFPESSISEIINDNNLKSIVLVKHIPHVVVAYNYGIINNWLRITNASPYTLHDIEIKVFINYKDGSQTIIRRNLHAIGKNETIPPTKDQFLYTEELAATQVKHKYKDWLNNVFPRSGFSGYMSFWKSNIINIQIEVNCKEKKLIDNKIIIRVSKG